MASILNEIGLFQFENLILNRIPFTLVNLGVDTTGLFPPYHQKHLEAQTLMSTRETALSDIQSRGFPRDQAIIILCHEGESSVLIVDELEGQGYSNVFYVKGGFTSLRPEQRSRGLDQ